MGTTAEPFSFFLGGTVYLGTVWGGVLGTVYGFVISNGTPDAALAGVMYGALVGLVLGLADGLVLYAMARVLGRPPRGEAPFRELGGAACAVTSATLGYASFFVLAIDPGSLGFSVSVLVIYFPTLVATIAMWLSGRRVAGRYAREAL